MAFITLDPKESVRSESGKILLKTNGVEMETHFNIAQGGLTGIIKRHFTGASILKCDYTYELDSG